LASQTASEVIRDIGIHEMARKTDVASLVEVRETTASIPQIFGKLDELTSSAGGDEPKPFPQTTRNVCEKIIAIYYGSVLNACYAVLSHMVSRKVGVVGSLSSDADRVRSVGKEVYTGTTAAIIAFSRTLACERALDNICFSVVCPGPTHIPVLEDTQQQTCGRRQNSDAWSRRCCSGAWPHWRRSPSEWYFWLPIALPASLAR
jgi:2-hydroxycyclohexanecarboxyl-CoA dehydrogenase